MSSFNPVDDHPFQGEMPEPLFCEAQQWNVTDGQWGVICHLGTMPGDIKLWHIAFAVTCPDGTVLATKLVGRGEKGTFGTHTMNTVTVEPYKRWRLRFDGAVRRYNPSELYSRPGYDGGHIPAVVELDITAAHDVWEPGARHDDYPDALFKSTYRMHHEQPLRAVGFIEVAGERVPFEGLGHRDHSQGPRERKTVQSYWVNGIFESGWAFATMVGVTDPGGEFERTAIYRNGRVIEAALEKWSDIQVSAPVPNDYEMVINCEGERLAMNVSCKNGINWFGPGRTEWAIGTDLSDPNSYLYTHYFGEFECNGEKGIGFVDRGARASLLKHP
ncbi:MAG TPA: hypothetical protein VJL90_09475 [Pseudorhodoplanes sp.]|nr:hypothetical protein [Pseudorhodoplanes sp.]